MTNCTREPDLFPALKSRKIALDFQGGDISSDGGGLLLRQVDRRIGLTQAVDRALGDPRRRASCSHRQLQMLRQRVYGLALGYEDLNDHLSLRHDPLLQTCVEAEQPLASAATLSLQVSAPTCSNTTSTPRPSVSLRTARAKRGCWT